MKQNVQTHTHTHTHSQPSLLSAPPPQRNICGSVSKAQNEVLSSDPQNLYLKNYKSNNKNHLAIVACICNISSEGIEKRDPQGLERWPSN